MLVAGNFQYKVKVFFKEIIPDYLLGKTKYAMRIEFQERRSPVVHSFIWMYINAPNIQNEDVCIECTEKTINAWLPDHLNDPELFELRLSKFMLIVELTGNTTRMNVDSRMVDILLRRLLLQNHLILNLVMMKARGFSMGKCVTKASQQLH